MIKSIIVARAANDIIGRDNDLVWHLPADLRYFKAKTMGHYLIMGRKTFESLGKPLPGRTTVIITRNADYEAQGCFIKPNLKEALAIAQNNEQSEVLILGGGEIYKQAMDITNKIYLTEVHGEFEGDTCFPKIDSNVWEETRRRDFLTDEKHRYAYSFVELERK